MKEKRTARIKKAIKNRINKARLLKDILKDSYIFNIKRRKLKKTFNPERVSTIVVDMDGTIIRKESVLEALALMYPEKIKGKKSKGEKLYQEIIDEIVGGELTLAEAVVAGHYYLIEKNFTYNDMLKVFNKVKFSIRDQLIFTLKYLQEVKGKKIILATLSSKDFGLILNEYLKKKYFFSFNEIIGTELKFNKEKKLVGVKKIIGLGNGESKERKERTKHKALQELFKEKKWKFSDKKIVLITDSYGDIDLARKVFTILIKPNEKPSLAQRVSSIFRLSDKQVKDDFKLQTNLIKILG